MSSPKYVLTVSDEAREDFRDIISFTIQMWGSRQGDEYGDSLNKTLNLIESNPKIGHTKTGLKNEILCFSAKRHLIFYTIIDSTVYVLRILHDSMDYVRHLNDTIP